MTLEDDNTYMSLAMEEAHKAFNRNEVPIGAILVHKNTGEVTARSSNSTIADSDPTAHAEINVIRNVCQKIEGQRIPDYHLYVTLEPCTMCAAAIAFARIPKLVFAASDKKGGGVLHGAKFFEQPTCHHHIIIEHGIQKEQSSNLLKNFFKTKR